jgi:hypothetical protein
LLCFALLKKSALLEAGSRNHQFVDAHTVIHKEEIHHVNFIQKE